MKKYVSMFLVLFLFVMNGPVSVYAAYSAQQQLIDPLGTNSGGYFSRNLDLDGDRLAVSAYYYGGGRGAAWVYKRSGTTWSVEPIQNLGEDTLCYISGGGELQCIAHNSVVDRYAHGIGISGDDLIIGAWNHREGEVYQGGIATWYWDGSQWAPAGGSARPYLLDAEGLAWDQLGWSVAVDGDNFITSAVYDDDTAGDEGSIFFSAKSGGVWGSLTKIKNPHPEGGDNFGWDVDIDGNYAVVGVPYDDDGADPNDSGAAYIYYNNAGTWELQAEIKASDIYAGDYFGYSVAISGDYIIVGAPFKYDNLVAYPGAAYVFVRSGTLWSQQEKIIPTDQEAWSKFGAAVAINGTTALVGSTFEDNENGDNAGSLYAFTRSGTDWTESQKIIAEDGGLNEFFGGAPAVDGNYVVSGQGETAQSNTEVEIFYQAPAGGGVPEFSDYLFLLTIIIATGLMVKIVPNINVNPLKT